jgi:hypothetical protein
VGHFDDRSGDLGSPCDGVGHRISRTIDDVDGRRGMGGDARCDLPGEGQGELPWAVGEATLDEGEVPWPWLGLDG